MKKPLRVTVSELRAGSVELSDEAARYVTRVHRKQAGDELELFDVEARLVARAVLGSVRPAIVEVDEPRPAEDQSMPLLLLQAIGKGDKPEQVVRDATALGARAVTFVLTERSVARGSGAERPERLERVALEAARQSGRAGIPEVKGPVAFATALADARGARLIAATTGDVAPLYQALEALGGRAPEGGGLESGITLFVGPEGGFSSAEMDAAAESGFVPVGLGPLVLRTETAATALLGAVRAFLDRTSR